VWCVVRTQKIEMVILIFIITNKINGASLIIGMNINIIKVEKNWINKWETLQHTFILYVEQINR
jgi:hypothetical protein